MEFRRRKFRTALSSYYGQPCSKRPITRTPQLGCILGFRIDFVADALHVQHIVIGVNLLDL